MRRREILLEIYYAKTLEHQLYVVAVVVVFLVCESSLCREQDNFVLCQSSSYYVM